MDEVFYDFGRRCVDQDMTNFSFSMGFGASEQGESVADVSMAA